jgi:acetylornithine aminotransferase
MKPTAVYSILNIEPVRAEGYYIWDKQGNKYLDFYGGHAVISIGHRHPHWVSSLKNQIDSLPFYSNAVIKPIEERLAEKLGRLSGYANYSMFLCNSGAEANENAIKAASFSTGRAKLIAFDKAFHGRTSAAVAVSGYSGNIAPVNAQHDVIMLPFNNTEVAVAEILKGQAAAVIIEGIQGVGGILVPNDDFLQAIRKACDESGTLLIADEVQSGYGRTGKFFAHQHSGVVADIITTAKGMGNGFPVASALIGPQVKIKNGQLGSTFGGNHMACAAANAVLEVIESEDLIANAASVGEYLKEKLKTLPGIKEIRGRGLMLAVEFLQDAASVRDNLLFEQKLFTGHSGTATIRLLPALNVTKVEADEAFERIKAAVLATMVK